MGAGSSTQDREVFYAMPSGSATAIVAFGAKGGGLNHFHFFKLLEPLPELSKLLVRDPSDSWYNAGLPGVGDTLTEIAAAIERELAALGAERILTCGSSMGGYAAILFGCMLGAERAIAIGPQTLLDPALPHAPPPGTALQAPDLAPIVCDSPATRVDLVFGRDELLDIFHADRIAGPPWVRLLAVEEGHHLFLADLQRKGGLAPLVVDLLEGRVPGICDVAAPLEASRSRRIAEAVYAAQRQDWAAAVQSIGPIAERDPAWAGASFHYGRALAGLGEHYEAELALRRAVEGNSRWVAPRERLAELLCERGRAGEAETVIRAGLAGEPTWWRGLLGLAECLRRQGREEEARAAAREVEEGVAPRLAREPGWAQGHLARGRALGQLGREEEARSALRRAARLNPSLAPEAEKLR